MSVEAELKYLDVDHAALRRRLVDLGAQREGRWFEENLVLDDAERGLRARGLLLRLRRTPRGARLTVKAPCVGEEQAGLKLRREYESGVEDMEAVRLGLEALGYRPALAYEKVRETWRIDGAEICLDHLPFGDFVEIEGPAGAIATLAGRLLLHENRTSRASYHELNRAWRAERGLPSEESFVFSSEERARLRREISG